MENDPHPVPISEFLLPEIGTAGDSNPALPFQHHLSVTQAWPEEIIVEPSRLATGVWGEQEGDINAAYCADTFPKIKVFTHQGQLYTSCGGGDDLAICYPLILSNETKSAVRKPYSYEGETVIHNGQSFTIGPKMRFISRDRTFQEEANLLQRKYAHGGYFVSGKTYREMLLAFLESQRISQRLRPVIEGELARGSLPETQAEMLRQLGGISDKARHRDCEMDDSQPALPGM